MESAHRLANSPPRTDDEHTNLCCGPFGISSLQMSASCLIFKKNSISVMLQKTELRFSNAMSLNIWKILDLCTGRLIIINIDETLV